MSNPERDAEVAWFRDHQDTCDASTLGPLPAANEFLRNRLAKCLAAGIAIGRKLQLDEDVKRLQEVLKPS